MDGYKHYIRTDEAGVIILGFSSAFPEIAEPQDGDICIEEDGPRQFTEVWSEPLTNERGQFRYMWVAGERAERSQTELDAELAAIPESPDPDDEIAVAIEAATTLAGLKAALLGNGRLARVKGKMK